MLHKNEADETATEIQPIASERMSLSHAQSPNSVRSPNVALEAAVNCLEVGIARNKRRGKTVEWVNQIYMLICYPTAVWAGMQGLVILEWVVGLSIVNALLRRTTLNLVYARDGLSRQGVYRDEQLSWHVLHFVPAASSEEMGLREETRTGHRYTAGRNLLPESDRAEEDSGPNR